MKDKKMKEIEIQNRKYLKYNIIIHTYLRGRGIEQILRECDYNLRSVKNHLRRICHLSKDKDMTSVMRLFKDYIAATSAQALSNDESILTELKKGFKDENI